MDDFLRKHDLLFFFFIDCEFIFLYNYFAQKSLLLINMVFNITKQGDFYEYRSKD